MIARVGKEIGGLDARPLVTGGLETEERIGPLPEGRVAAVGGDAERPDVAVLVGEKDAIDFDAVAVQMVHPASGLIDHLLFQAAIKAAPIGAHQPGV